jgi:hypothetical protein
MTPARWTFVIIFGLGLLTGLGIGITELVAPNLATVTLNDQDVTGLTGFWTALLSGSLPGLILGLVVAGIVALFTRKKKAKA